jgi:hypothetical protein
MTYIQYTSKFKHKIMFIYVVFFILCTEFRFGHMQTKFFQSFPHKGRSRTGVE